MPSIELDDVSWNGYGGGQPAISGQPCTITLQRTRMSALLNSDVAVYANGESIAGGAVSNRGSLVTVDRTVIDGGGPALGLFHYSSLNMTNSVLTNQGGSFGPVQFDGSTRLSTVAFSTFHNLTWNCNGSSSALLFSSNNIFLNEQGGAPPDTLSGAGCNHAYVLVKPQSTTPVGGASNILNMDPRFKNALQNDFHLTSGSPAIDAADPTATDPVDYDGTPRPQGPRRDIGAFEYK